MQKQSINQEFENMERCIDYILQKLLMIYPTNKLLQNIQSLIINELSKAERLDEQSRSIYDSEMIVKHNTVMENMNHLEYLLLVDDETSDTTKDMAELEQLAKEQSLDVIDGNIFFSFQPQ